MSALSSQLDLALERIGCRRGTALPAVEAAEVHRRMEAVLCAPGEGSYWERFVAPRVSWFDAEGWTRIPQLVPDAGASAYLFFEPREE
ncbi:MAG: hypothetical protein ACK4N5_16655, partial [Myxococcales bacterium]